MESLSAKLIDSTTDTFLKIFQIWEHVSKTFRSTERVRIKNSLATKNGYRLHFILESWYSESVHLQLYRGSYAQLNTGASTTPAIIWIGVLWIN